MAEKTQNINWKMVSGFGITLIILPVIIAVWTGLWVITAVPIGFLFGFFLQKGALCGSSAFSEVLIMRDFKKIYGIWIVIITGMGGFALLDLTGWVILNPKPFTWLNMIAGGAVFGTGMVLAGGCVVGSLFKAGIGHINSITALLTIALGIAAVNSGPLAGLNKWMEKHTLQASDGGPVTLGSITGLSFQILASIIILATIAAAFIRRRKNKEAEESRKCGFSEILVKKRWAPWKAGLAIGILGAFAYLSASATGRNYPLGVTNGVYHAQVLLTDSPVQHVYQKAAQPIQPAAVRTGNPSAKPAPNPGKRVSWWLIALVFSIVPGSWLAARLSGEAKLYNKSADQILVSIIGGFMVGAGAAFAKGCVVGNIMSGWALMSMGTAVFGVTAVLFNWAATYFYLMGGTLADLRRNKN